MKKFALITIGFTPPTSEIMTLWMQWFQSIENKIVEQIGFMNGKEVFSDGIKDLAMDKDAITGCIIIEAQNMNEALEIAQKSPMITSTKVYELRSH